MYFRYLDNRVFVSLANGDITIYSRDQGKLHCVFLNEVYREVDIGLFV